MNLLTPLPKAGINLPPPGSEACGCCVGVDASTPQAHPNRHGLSAVSYRIGAHAQFRESLIAGLSDSGFEPLPSLLTRDDDDFTIGLIDAFACAADVLTFYQERIANESWLRTATERTSLQEMARLIGYRLRPGLAAETWLAFALEPPREPPPDAPKDPGSFVTGIPTALTLEAGLKVQSVPGPGEKPQTFETMETITARPQWNAIRPWLALPRWPVKGDFHTWLQGVKTNLKPGDALLISGAEFEADTGSNRWDFRILSEVTPDNANDRTYVAWRRGLGSVYPSMSPAASGVRVFALRQRASVFGHNAPMWRTMPEKFIEAYEDTSSPDLSVLMHTVNPVLSGLTAGIAIDPPQWPDFVISPMGAGFVDLDAAYPGIAPGSYAVLAHGQYDSAGESTGSTYVELYRIAGASDVSRDEFALSGKSTRLQLEGGNYDKFTGLVRQTRVFAQSEELHFAAYPVTDAVVGEHVPAAVTPDGLEAGRRVIVQGEPVTGGGAVVHLATLAAATAQDGYASLQITPPLPQALRRDSVRIAANVALSRHGETVAQVLGSGDAAQQHQHFELKQLPLTYRAASTELGAASELTMRVGGVEWKERRSLYGSDMNARVYTVQDDEAGRLWLRFGDGVNGARLPSGSQNLRASYRKGLGRDGNVRAETLTQLMTRPLGLKGVANPSPAAGGTDPEPAEQARESMPLGTRTLGRAVSLLDYEHFALAYTGIAKAQAAVLRLRHGPVIALTVAGQDGVAIGPDNPIWNNLRDALRDSGDPHVQAHLLGYQASTFRLGLKVKCDPEREEKTVLAAVEVALRDAFSFARRRLGQPVQQSEVVAVVHAVPGVIAVDLDLLYGGSAPYAQTLPSRQARLLASRMRVSSGHPWPAELLTLHPGPLDRLEAMP